MDRSSHTRTLECYLFTSLCHSLSYSPFQFCSRPPQNSCFESMPLLPFILNVKQIKKSLKEASDLPCEAVAHIKQVPGNILCLSFLSLSPSYDILWYSNCIHTFMHFIYHFYHWSTPLSTVFVKATRWCISEEPRQGQPSACYTGLGLLGDLLVGSPTRGDP